MSAAENEGMVCSRLPWPTEIKPQTRRASALGCEGWNEMFVSPIPPSGPRDLVWFRCIIWLGGGQGLGWCSSLFSGTVAQYCVHGQNSKSNFRFFLRERFQFHGISLCTVFCPEVFIRSPPLWGSAAVLCPSHKFL